MVEQGTLVATKRYKESDEQIKAMEWLRQTHPLIALHTMHIGNERKASYYMGWLMKQMGVLKGASDLFMAWPNGGYHGLFIEVKSKTGKASPDQKAFLQRMKEAGYKAEICHGADQVINTMKEYLALPRDIVIVNT